METKKLPKGLFGMALIMSFGSLPPMLDSTIVNIAVNDMAKIFNTDLATIQWIVTGYVLALGVSVPFSGWLIQKFNGKKVYMASVAMFVIASMLTGISWNIASMIIFRIIQGSACGILIPTLYALLVREAKGENLGRIMSIVGIPVIFGPIVGPILGGLILQYMSWHWLFYVNVPVGAVSLFFIWRKVPDFQPTDKNAKLDWIGILLLVVASSTLIFGITEIVLPGEFVLGLVPIIVGIIAALSYIPYARNRDAKAQKNQGQSVISLDLFRYNNFTASFVLLFMTGFNINGPLLLLPMFFQNVRGLNIFESALWLLPQGLGVLMTRTSTGKYIDRLGSRVIVLPAILLIIAGTLPFAFVGANTSHWVIWGALLIRGMGVGGFFIAVMSDSYVGLSKDQVPAASVATRIIQNVGAAFGAAVLITVVSDILLRNASDEVGAYHAAFAVSIVFLVLAILPAFFLTNKLGRKEVERA